MASIVKSSQSDYQLAMCRLVQETTEHDSGQILDYFILGLGCLVAKPQFGFPEAASKSNCFLVASGDVLTKPHLQAVDSKMKGKKKDKPSVKIVAEFLAMDGTDKYERFSLVEFYDSVDRDICESSGILYIALTKLDRFNPFKRTPLKRRPKLQVFDFSEKSFSIRELLDTEQLRCHVFCGDTTKKEDKISCAVMSTRIYDLFAENASESSEGYTYFLTNGAKERYYTEDELKKEEKKCPGGIILNGDCRFVGVLNFRDSHLEPVTVGSKSETGTSSGFYPKPTEESQEPTSVIWCHSNKTQKRHEEIYEELNVGAAGGILPPFEGQSSMITVVPHSADGKDTKHSPQPVAKSTDTKQSVMDLDGHDTSNNGQSHLDTSMTTPIDGNAAISYSEMPQQFRNISSPIENSYASDCQWPSDEEAPDPLWENGSQQTEALVRDVLTNSEFPELKGEAALKVTLPPVSGLDKPFGSTAPKPLVQSSRCNQPLIQGSKERTLAASGGASYDHLFFQQKRRSLPVSRSSEAQHPTLQRCSSDSLQRQRSRRLFSLDDPLAKSVQNSLELLEELGRCLDKEYKYGKSKCWKHLAEEFEIKAEVYEQFSCCQIHSPTEVLFEYLATCQWYLKVGTLKDALGSIDRNDVVQGVLVKHEESERRLTNETLVSSLFDSNPDIIGEMAFLLDKDKHGVKGWRDLAAQLDIARKVFRTFESSTDENPTNDLFEWLCIHQPRLTIGELKSHLDDLQRPDVVVAISQSNMVKDNSVIKDLMEDLETMENVCELLNRKGPTCKIRGWRHLGNRFKIKKAILDDFSPSEGKQDAGPTEVLVSHLAANSPGLKLVNLIWALHRIERPDALIVLEKYLPDGCILQLLKGCDC